MAVEEFLRDQGIEYDSCSLIALWVCSAWNQSLSSLWKQTQAKTFNAGSLLQFVMRIALFASCHALALLIAASRIFLAWPSSFEVSWQWLPVAEAFICWALLVLALCATWRTFAAARPARAYLVALAAAALSASSWVKDLAALCLESCARAAFYGLRSIESWVMLLQLLVFLVALGLAANAFRWLWRFTRPPVT